MKATAITASVILILIGLCGLINMGVDATENKQDGSWQLLVFSLVGLAVVGFISFISYAVKSVRSEDFNSPKQQPSQPVQQGQLPVAPLQQELPPRTSRSGGVLFVPLPLDEQNRPDER